VLKEVSANIAKIMRPEDVFGRYGGEEFLVVARNTSEQHAEILAERIRRLTEQLVVPRAEHALRVTVSIGVAAAGPHDYAMGAQGLLAAADDALYAAKRAGRNRVAVAARLRHTA
jgi:diguanylate cyclase (GGDEF)-like protein